MSRPTLEDIIGADMAPFVVCTDWSFADGDTLIAREWKRRAEVNDRVWRVLNGLRERAVGDRRTLHKNQQYAHGYGASLRSLHEMARAWPEQGRLIEAQRFAHAYGTGPQKMGRWLRPGSPTPVRTENYMVQSRAAAEHMSRLHEAMLEAGWEWDGMDGYTAPGLNERKPGDNTGPNGECLTCNGFGTIVDISIGGRRRSESCDDCDGTGMGQ